MLPSPIHQHPPPTLKPHQLPQPIPKRYQHQPHAHPRQHDISRPHLRRQPNVRAQLVDLVLGDAGADSPQKPAEHEECQGGAGDDGVGEKGGALAAGDEEEGEDGGEEGEAGQAEADDEERGEGFEDGVERVEGVLDVRGEAEVKQRDFKGADAEGVVKEGGDVVAWVGLVWGPEEGGVGLPLVKPLWHSVTLRSASGVVALGLKSPSQMVKAWRE